MTNLPSQDEAMALLATAKENLQADGSLCPVVFVFTGETCQIYALKFDGADEKRRMYASLWEHVLPMNPSLIVSIHDSYIRKYDKDAPLPPNPGDLESKKKAGDAQVGEALVMSVYARGENAWMVSSPYSRDGDAINFWPDEIHDNSSGMTLSGQIGPQPWLKAANIMHEFEGKKDKTVN